MKKKSLSAKKTIHKSLINHLNNKKIYKVFNSFENYLNEDGKKTFSLDKRFGVAISGGPDSLALAYLAKCYFLKNKLNGNFFIVDHKLRENSLREARSVKILLKKFDINCKILEWKGKKPKSNIQGVARNSRYDLLKKACKKNKINKLLIGHHIDDLYENFFIRLLRGSGLKGLSSFGEPTKIGDKLLILRPLIKHEKKELIYISKIVFNFFVEDPSNKNFVFKRTRIRKFISDLNDEGFDIKKFNLTIRNLKSANQAINFYVEKNIKDNAIFIEQKKRYVLNKFFFNQTEEVTFRSFSLILKKIGGNYYSPRGKSVANAISKILLAKIKKFNLGGCYIEKVNDTILITKEN